MNPGVEHSTVSHHRWRQRCGGPRQADGWRGDMTQPAYVGINGICLYKCILYIEWASALCRRPPLCGGGRAGSVNKTTGEVKTFKTYTKQTGGSSSWVQFVYLRIWEELLGFFQNRSLTGGLRILALRSDAKPTFTVAISGRKGIGSKCYFHLGNVLSLGLCFN